MKSRSFDDYGEEAYRRAISEATSFAGQRHDVFIEAKAAVLLDVCSRSLGDASQLSLLDVGCGVGLTDDFLVPKFGSVSGCDISARAVAEARARNPALDYRVSEGVLPFEDGAFDVTVAICVLHHVPLPDRPTFVAQLGRVTRPGGLVVVIEHNPLNPLTRLVVSRCDFDDDAVLLGASEARRLCRCQRLNVCESRYLLFFPWRRKQLIALEQHLGWLPFGAQYLVAAKRGAEEAQEEISVPSSAAR